MSRLLSDPRLFSYVIMALYLLNALRWAYDRKMAGRMLLAFGPGHHRHRHIWVQALT